MKRRTGRVKRVTRETSVEVVIDLDGEGAAGVDTGIAFFDHMLTLFAYHGCFDLKISARGDLKVDFHHTVEDVGICLGQALARAWGDKKGIRRYGASILPMDEALALVSVDLGGRGWLVYNSRGRRIKIGDFNVGLVPQFLKAVCDQACATIHVNVLYGRDPHHILEAAFKGLGRAFSQAVEKQPRRKGSPSTK